MAYAGPHGFQTTEPSYPPFRFVNVRNFADNANPKTGEVTADVIETVCGLAVEIHHINGYPLDIPRKDSVH